MLIIIVLSLQYIYIYMCVCVCVFCQLSVTSCHMHCTREPNMQLPEDGKDIWPKRVRVVYNKYKNIVQIIGGEICVFNGL